MAEIRQTGESFMPFVLASGEFDRAVRAGAVSAILAIAAGEVQVNVWVVEEGGWTDEEDKLLSTASATLSPSALSRRSPSAPNPFGTSPPP